MDTLSRFNAIVNMLMIEANIDVYKKLRDPAEQTDNAFHALLMDFSE